MRILPISVIINLLEPIFVNGNFLDRYSDDRIAAMIYESTIQKPSKLILPSDENHDWVADVTGLESKVSQPFEMLRFMFKGYV